MGKTDYTFPLPTKNLHNRYDPIFNNLKRGLSTTIVGLPLSSRSAFFKFILEGGKDYLNSFTSNKGFEFLIVNNKLLSDSDLLKELIIKIADKLNVSVSQGFDPLLVQFAIENILRKQNVTIKIVLFIPDFNEILLGKPETIDFLIRIGEINKHNAGGAGVLYCFTASSRDLELVIKNYPYKFSQLVHETTVKFDLLSSEEISYTRSRLEFFRNSQIDGSVHNMASRLSGGHYILYKTLTTLNFNELQKLNKIYHHPLMQDVILHIWNSTSTSEQKELQKLSPLFPPKIINTILDVDEILPLTSQEIDVFENFKTKTGKLVTRDEVAQAMWGAQWVDKYSDWAIDKLISKLKGKLIYSSYKILSVRGRGYKLINYAS